MTVSAVTPSVTYTYTAPATLDYYFQIYDETDLEVRFIDTSDNSVVILTITTDYTVTINPSTPGGTVSVTYVPPGGYGPPDVEIQIVRRLPRTQATDWVNNSAFDMDTLENDLDRLVMLIQEIEQALDEIYTTSAWKGDWTTGDYYALRDVVVGGGGNGNFYMAAVAHTAGTWATDLTAEKWILLVDVSTLTAIQTACEAAQTAAETAETNAAASASAASTSASSAASSASASATSASAAATSESNAATSETNASTSASAAATSATNAANSETAAATSAAAAADSASKGMYKDVTVVTYADSPYTVTEAESGDLLSVDTTSGNVVINLVSLSGAAEDFRVAVVKNSADANTVTVQRQSTDTINGGTSQLIDQQYERYNFVGDQSTGKYLAVGGLGEQPAGWTINTDVSSGTIVPADFSGRAPLTGITGSVTVQLANTVTAGNVWSYIEKSGGTITIDSATNSQTVLTPTGKSNAARGTNSIITLSYLGSNTWTIYGDLADA